VPNAGEAIGGQLGIAHGVLDAAVSEILLNGSGVGALVARAYPQAGHSWGKLEASFRLAMATRPAPQAG
jgi:hypothetical protein